ncbi:MAG: hypothetical protein D6720_13205 [Gammaproteobacteria bacterium]|nr:MAG: hypothetical protein D6720_13205 [Gammaproteobacteria bacterium]
MLFLYSHHRPRQTGQQAPVAARARDLGAKVKQVVTTDESKLQIVLQAEGMDNEALDQVRELLLLQQACPVLAAARQQVLSSFLDEVAGLVELEDKRAEADEMAAFYRNRLEYFKKAVDEGRVESDTLWGYAEKAKKASTMRPRARASWPP